MYVDLAIKETVSNILYKCSRFVRRYSTYVSANNYAYYFHTTKKNVCQDSGVTRNNK